ncbi:hypothetical protein [Saccharothrix sp. HUAS TT1]|uniref:phage terminase small subunit n=1 Tax=unclassified Saccharothrix TaxID=2593673 RepID=UPI00345BB66A
MPKRSEERVRRNKDEVQIEKITAIGTVLQPPLDFPSPHPITVDLYRSMGESAQARYYEPSDWEFARATLHFLDRLLKSTKPSGQMLATVNQMLTGLLLTEGERRRVAIEIERETTKNELADVAALFRDRAAQ